MSNLALGQLNAMFKNLNKVMYEIDGNINDLYYGKPVNSSSSSGGNFMAHSFGYGQPVQRGASKQKN